MASEYRWFTCATLRAADLPGPSRSVLFLEGSPDVKRNATPVTPSLLSQRETLGSASGAKHRSCGSALKVAQRTLAETAVQSPAAGRAHRGGHFRFTHSRGRARLQSTDRKPGSKE